MEHGKVTTPKQTQEPACVYLHTFRVPNEPYFVVGTPQEANAIRQAGGNVPASHVVTANEYETAGLEVTGNPATAGAAILLTNDATARAWQEALGRHGYASTARYTEAYATVAHDLQGKEATELLCSAYSETLGMQDGMRAEAINAMLEACSTYDTTDVAMDLFLLKYERTALSTGIGGLDRAFGGIPMGALTVLGAGSSSGKTTLCVQIADNLARSGHHVLFVSIEQGRHELVAKSISRLMRTSGRRWKASTEHIQSRAQRATWSQEKNQAMLQACSAYSAEIAPRLRIMQMNSQPTVRQVRDAAEAMRAAYGTAPVVIVDYLQLLRSPDERMSDKRATDVNVSDLRMMAKELGTAVVVISSINRASYNEGAGLESFKESGMVEYSADLALILQPRDYANRIKGSNDTKRKDNAREAMSEYKTDPMRRAEVVVLKNRGGAMVARPIPLLYDAMCNLFTDDEEEDGTTQRRKRVVL